LDDIIQATHCCKQSGKVCAIGSTTDESFLRGILARARTLAPLKTALRAKDALLGTGARASCDTLAERDGAEDNDGGEYKRLAIFWDEHSQHFSCRDNSASKMKTFFAVS